MKKKLKYLLIAIVALTLSILIFDTWLQVADYYEKGKWQKQIGIETHYSPIARLIIKVTEKMRP